MLLRPLINRHHGATLLPVWRSTAHFGAASAGGKHQPPVRCPSDFSDSLTAVSGNMFSQSHDCSQVPPGGLASYNCMGSCRILSQYGRNHWTCTDRCADGDRPQWVKTVSGGSTVNSHRLDIRSSAAANVHHDSENLPLFRTAAARVAAFVAERVKGGHWDSPELRVLDLGSGSGIWGLMLAAQFRYTAGLEGHCIRLVFSDITQAAIDLSLANAARSAAALGSQRPGAFEYEGFVGDMFDAISCKTNLSNNGGGANDARLKGSAPFDVILFNPPQTGGNEAFRASRFTLEKYGGEDGSLYYRRFAEEVASLVHDETACVLAQIGLANPVRVERSLRSAGFGVHTELVRQQRSTTVEAWESLALGLTAHQLKLREAGKADFSLIPEVERSDLDGGWLSEEEISVRVNLWQRVLLVRRKNTAFQ